VIRWLVLTVRVIRHRVLTHHRHPTLTRASLMYWIDCEDINLKICGSFFDAGYSLKWVILACLFTLTCQNLIAPCNYGHSISKVKFNVYLASQRPLGGEAVFRNIAGAVAINQQHRGRTGAVGGVNDERLPARRR
jgi:hypothetical protein